MAAAGAATAGPAGDAVRGGRAAGAGAGLRAGSRAVRRRTRFRRLPSLRMPGRRYAGVSDAGPSDAGPGLARRLAGASARAAISHPGLADQRAARPAPPDRLAAACARRQHPGRARARPFRRGPDAGSTAVADRLPGLGGCHVRCRVADCQHRVTRLGVRAVVTGVIPGTWPGRSGGMRGLPGRAEAPRPGAAGTAARRRRPGRAGLAVAAAGSRRRTGPAGTPAEAVRGPADSRAPAPFRRRRPPRARTGKLRSGLADRRPAALPGGPAGRDCGPSWPGRNASVPAGIAAGWRTPVSRAGLASGGGAHACRTATPTARPLVCTVVGPVAHAVERIAPAPEVRLVTGFRRWPAARSRRLALPLQVTAGILLRRPCVLACPPRPQWPGELQPVPADSRA